MVDVPAIASAAKNFACTLYKNQPGALIPNPISDALHFVWDNFCNYPGAPGLPNAPTAPFSGGQCVCGLYRIRTTFVYDGDTSPGDQLVTGIGEIEAYGAIGNTRTVAISPSLDGSPRVRIEIFCRGLNGEACTQSGVWRTAIGSVTNYRSHSISNLGRIDGGQDNCGSLAPTYPPTSPPPTDGYTSPPINFTFNDGDNISVNFNLKPPLPPIAPIVNLPPIVVNMIRPVANINIPIAFNFDGTVNFGGGGGGGGLDPDDRDIINNINNEVTNLGDTINNIQNEINNITNNNNNAPLNPNDFDTPVTNQPPGEYEQEYLGAVTIAITVIPANAKRQSGKDAPDVIYAGWFEWKQGGWKTPRQPIHFEDNIFLAPKGVNGFAYTLYHGFDGRATSIIYKEKV